jgi:hypothetical protein
MKINIINKKFNSLLVLEQTASPYKNTKARYFKCQCDCGKIIVVNYHRLAHNKTKDCRDCSSRRNGDLATKRKKGESGLKKLYGVYKRGAFSRGLLFELTLEEFKKLTSDNCFYCGIPPRAISKADCRGMSKKGIAHSTYIYNGIDRLNNKKGYILDNCAPCCKVCNRAKSNMDLDDFILWIQNLKDKEIDISKLLMIQLNIEENP